MGLPLLFSGCAVTLQDEEFCSPMPGAMGAACDHFLISKPEILDQAGWEARQALWISQGNAIECTTSKTVGDIKGEIEKLCSRVSCDIQTQTAILDGLNKIEKLGLQ